MKDILILGGGFGGVYTAHHLLKRLKKGEAEVTLVNKDNYFLFTPMIHEVATGNIRINNVVQPIREILKGNNFNFCKATVEKIDLDEQKVRTDKATLEYDYLVVALGSETNFFGMEGKEKAFTLKSLHDAYNLRNHVIDSYENASLVDDKERNRLLTIAVVGGGPTGVELSAELADWTKILTRHYPEVCPEDVSIKLINPDQKVLKGIDEKLRDKAMKVLEKKGVDLMIGGQAESIGDSYVECVFGDKRKKIETDTIIWTAGVKPVEIDVKGVQKQRGRIPVSQKFLIDGRRTAFALGDIAAYESPDGSHPPPTAQLATQEAKVVASNIITAMRGGKMADFEYKSKGFLASLGSGQAIAKINGVRFYGPLAWWVWRTIYLMKLIGLENKIRVMIDWTFDLFFPRDTSQV